MCVPPLAVHLRDYPYFGIGDLSFILPFFLLSALGSVILWLPIVRRHSQGIGWVPGVALGLFLPPLAGLAYLKLYPGFSSGLVFLYSMVMALPSATGGALAGWLRSRPGRKRAKSSGPSS
jgi:hypothetical protein